MIKEKILAHLIWFFAVIPFGIISLSALIVYPVAQLIEFVFPNHNPLWWYMDDEIEDDSINGDWKNTYNELPKWLKYYVWHGWRNRMWNLKASIKPKNARKHCEWNEEDIVEVIKDTISRDGQKLSIYGKCLEMPGYKWVTKDGVEGWLVFRGEKISEKYSNVGEIRYWYRAKGRLYYRRSVAEERDIICFVKTFPFIGKRRCYYEFSMGANEKWYLLNLKIKRKYKQLKQ